MKNRYFELLRQIEHDRTTEQVTTKDSHILIIDGLNTFIRVFSAVPALNDDGEHIGGVTGFLRSVASTIRQIKPTRCVVVFDGKGGSVRRRKIYSDYKANRAVKTKFNRHEEFASLEDESASMKHQFTRIIEYMQCLPVTMMAIDNIEADDAIGYIANEMYTDEKHKVTIVSTDRDFLQLVNNRISVWSPVKKKLYTPQVLREEFGFSEKNYLLYRTFIGDKSDNIPGLDGVGLKSLLKYFPLFTEDREITIDEIVEYAQSVEKKYKVHEQVANNKHVLELNHDLMQLKDVDIPGNTKLLIADIMRRPVERLNTYEFKKMFMADKMYTVIKDVDGWMNGSFNTLNAYTNL